MIKKYTIHLLVALTLFLVLVIGVDALNGYRYEPFTSYTFYTVILILLIAIIIGHIFYKIIGVKGVCTKAIHYARKWAGITSYLFIVSSFSIQVTTHIGREIDFSHINAESLYYFIFDTNIFTNTLVYYMGATAGAIIILAPITFLIGFLYGKFKLRKGKNA